MEIFLLIIVLVFLILTYRFASSNSHALYDLKHDLSELKKKVEQLSKPAVSDSIEKWRPKEIPIPVQKMEDLPKKQDSPIEPAAPIKDAIPIKPIETFPKPELDIKKEEEQKSPVPIPSYLPEEKPTFQEPQISWFQKWLKDNPDMEKFIGENLINKIGIAVLVLGIAFFVKYAIDQDWINKLGRVCIGLFCGIILIGLAHRLRKNYHSFSSVLVGGGLAVFYFTIALAFHQYQLLSQVAAFSIMVVITLFAVVLSILYDRMEIGIIAAVGGFLTPFMVSTGDGNYFVLFSYLCILNAGLIALAYYKRWRVLNFLAFFFTETIYLGYVFDKINTPHFPFQNIFIFGTIFYIMFVAMNVIHHVARGSKLKAFDFIVLLSVNLFFYGTGIFLLKEWGNEMYNGLFTASIGGLNLILAYLFFKRSKADKNFVYLLIGITVTFISLTAPTQLKGHYITLFWAAETVVLLWLYQKSFIKLIKIASLLVTALMVISLWMDWVEMYLIGNAPMPILFNKGFVTSIFAAICLLVNYILLRKEADTLYLGVISTKVIRSVYLGGSVLLAFCAGALEIFYQFSHRFPSTGLEYVYLELYVIAFALLVVLALEKFKIQLDLTISLALPLVIFILYVMNISNIYFTEKDLLTAGHFRGYFMANWISVILLLLLIYRTMKFVQKNSKTLASNLSSISWVICIVTLLLLSVEIRHLYVWMRYSNPDSIELAENIYVKAGLSMVWGLSSFAIIWLGMSHRFKPLRIIALVVFGLTLLKLFAFDIRNISPGGKIAAFILLGVLLLIVSFMYQRLKKIIIDNETDPK